MSLYFSPAHCVTVLSDICGLVRPEFNVPVHLKDSPPRKSGTASLPHLAGVEEVLGKYFFKRNAESHIELYCANIEACARAIERPALEVQQLVLIHELARFVQHLGFIQWLHEVKDVKARMLNGPRRGTSGEWRWGHHFAEASRDLKTLHAQSATWFYVNETDQHELKETFLRLSDAFQTMDLPWYRTAKFQGNPREVNPHFQKHLHRDILQAIDGRTPFDLKSIVWTVAPAAVAPRNADSAHIECPTVQLRPIGLLQSFFGRKCPS